MKKYHYFVSFHLKYDRYQSTDNTEIIRDKIIDSMDDIRDMERFIEEEHSHRIENAYIINYQLLKIEDSN